MVGVATSNKCTTCRIKKIKCDQQRPRCGQCRKGVRVCEWSKRPATFLNRSTADYEPPPPQGGGVRFRNQFTDDFVWASQEAAGTEPPCPPCRPRKVRKALPTARARGLPAPLSPASSPPPPLQFQSWLHDEILSEFLGHCLAPPSATQEVPLAWFRSLVPMEKRIDALPLAMSAVAVGWAGRAGGRGGGLGGGPSRHLAAKGLQLYHAAVRQLRHDVVWPPNLDDARGYRDEATLLPPPHLLQQLLATTAILTAYELFEFGTDEASLGWVCHVSGIAAALRALGPARVACEPYREVFSFVRTIYMVQGMRRRQTACAAAPMWRTIPYTSAVKSDSHNFLDLALQATELLEEADSLPKEFTGDRPADCSRARATLCRILEHIQSLREWEHKAQIPLVNGPLSFVLGSNGAVTTAATATSDAPTKQPSGRTTLRGYPSRIPEDAVPATFDSLQNARLMHLYWGVLLTLYATVLENPALRQELESLQGEAETPWRHSGTPEFYGSSTMSAVANAASADQMRREAGRLADRIALYGEFCCQNLWQSFGPMVNVFTLETAIRWYQNHGDSIGTSSPVASHGLPPRSNPHLEHCQALLNSIRMQPQEREAFDAFQDATFGDIDILRLPWCH